MKLPLPKSAEAFSLRTRRGTLDFPQPALVMGILNVTPDSFSDGGRYLDPSAAVDHGLNLAAEGAVILDIGGESTRPGAEPVPEAVELRRVVPVIERLARQTAALLSIDTMKPAVARAAVEAGAAIINDVAANRPDPVAMWEVVAESGAGYVCMHMQGTPETMQHTPRYGEVVEDIADFFAVKLDALQRHAVAPEQVILDPGIGFGKAAEHNLQLLAGLGRFRRLQRPLLVGASRKSFIGKLLGATVQERLPGSLACACWSVLAGAQIVRTHDVAETVQALRLTEAIARYAPP